MQSALKPYCDGSHVTSRFTGAKDPKRVPDHRDTYPGQEVTIFDNRGICQHSGLCTDRLTSVFRTSQEPFVAPSGGRMDEIIRAVRDCPSGALSYCLRRHESGVRSRLGRPPRAGVEVPRTARTAYRWDAAPGTPAVSDVARAAGSSREHYALCRCGHSQNKPFCSGMHWYVNFSDPVRSPARSRPYSSGPEACPR